VKNLITGVNGFAGSHLADYLLSRGEEVFGLCRTPGPHPNLRHLSLQVFPCDIRDAKGIRNILEKVAPGRIYHLAAQSFVPAAEKEADSVRAINLGGTVNLLEQVRALGLPARVLFVGSSEEYGPVEPGESPIGESRPRRPATAYGEGKAAAEDVAERFAREDGLDVVRVRPFNHIGPRQDGRFVSSSFARQIAQIEAGAEPVLRVGNLEARRDFTDVRDTVRAYGQLMEGAERGEVYNVCSGRPVKIRSLLDILLSLSPAAITVETDPGRYRPETPVDFFGDPSRLTKCTGWRPEIPLAQTLEDLLAFWRQKVSGKPV